MGKRKITSYQKTNLLVSLALFGITSFLVLYKQQIKPVDPEKPKPNGFSFPKLKYMESPPQNIPSNYDAQNAFNEKN